MATQQKIAANRANAKRSTGPKTAAGKRRSSGNAFRHGLSGAMPDDGFTLFAIEAIARVVAGDSVPLGEDQIDAVGFARAQLELRRIREVRTGLLALLDPKHLTPEKLRRVAALDRYERVALAKRRRATLALAKRSTSSRQQDQSE